ncbi:uncharacterized protein V6R79_012265 [Siganus canaliculatus]
MGTSSSEFCQRTNFRAVENVAPAFHLFLHSEQRPHKVAPAAARRAWIRFVSFGFNHASNICHKTFFTTFLFSAQQPTTSSQNVSSPVQELQEDTFVPIDEGDILKPVDRNAVKSLWPEATVPYTISKDLAQRESDVLAAFKMISDVTCIRFKPLSDEFSYIKFRTGKGCASFVGCQGGAQSVFYSESCSVGNLCHEIVHALGLHHEHTRKDRDQHVTVDWNSIMSGRQKNFKMNGGDTLDLPYDLDSIMHYGKYFFSKNGSPTVVPKNGGAQIGQRTHLSRLDIKKLNRLYHCGNL